ncbi:MAG: aminotransferase [Pseudomonadota bacterium]
MKIEPFGVELWMNEFESRCSLNLAETCVDSVTLAELLALAGEAQSSVNELLSLKLTYGAIEGSRRVRQSIAALYARQTPENTLITHGTIGANSLVHQTLVSAGDHVVTIVPTYQQHVSIPASVGAEVQQIALREGNAFLPDLDELAGAVNDRTRLIAVTNPNNPTGSLMDQSMLEQLAAVASTADAWLLCDEVYRGVDQQDPGTTPSIADLYEKGISTASVSKVFSLAGLRLGWIVAPIPVIEAVMIHRDYNTISVGMINDYLAALALENHPQLLARSRRITRQNLELLSAWVDAEPGISWVKPRSGTTALLKYDLALPSRTLCIELLDATGVMLTPGSAMGMEGYVRIGFANSTATLEQGLARLSEFLASRRAARTQRVESSAR